MRRMFTLVAVLLLATVGSLTFASPASAYAQGCTAAPYGYVCNTTYGNGNYVPQVTAIRTKASASWICNYTAHISVLDGRNTANVKYFRSFYHGGCTVGRAWFDAYPQRYFSCGDITSVAWFEDGVRQGGYANIRLC
jgi:hypothetical protein